MGSYYNYNPGVSDRSGELMAQGIGVAGQAVAGGIDKWKVNKKENKFLDSSLAVLQANNPDLITPDILEKFHSGGLGAKRGIFTQLLTEASEQKQLAAEERRATREDTRFAQRERTQEAQWQQHFKQQRQEAKDFFNMQHEANKPPPVTPGSIQTITVPGPDGQPSKMGIVTVNGKLASGVMPFGPDQEGVTPEMIEKFGAAGLSLQGVTKDGHHFAPAKEEKAPAGPKPVTVTTPDGKRMTVIQDPATGKWVPLQVEGAGGGASLWDAALNMYEQP